MTELVFVRHGETEANAVGIWQGWSDTALNATGRAQAEAVGRHLAANGGRIEALYTSPLRRALQTAVVIGEHLNLKPQTMDGLKEMHFGRLEGMSLKQVEADYPDVYSRWQNKGDATFQWPEGERRDAFFERAAGACRWICRRHEGDTVAIVAHGGTIRACLGHLLPDTLGRWWTYQLDNAGVTRVQVEGCEAELLALNHTGHLIQGEGHPV